MSRRRALLAHLRTIVFPHTFRQAARSVAYLWLFAATNLLLIFSLWMIWPINLNFYTFGFLYLYFIIEPTIVGLLVASLFILLIARFTPEQTSRVTAAVFAVLCLWLAVLYRELFAPSEIKHFFFDPMMEAASQFHKV